LSGSKPGHVRYVAESGSKFRALAATQGANRKDPICFSPYVDRAQLDRTRQKFRETAAIFETI
jgi:hypothetical protein